MGKWDSIFKSVIHIQFFGSYFPHKPRYIWIFHISVPEGPRDWTSPRITALSNQRRRQAPIVPQCPDPVFLQRGAAFHFLMLRSPWEGLLFANLRPWLAQGAGAALTIFLSRACICKDSWLQTAEQRALVYWSWFEQERGIYYKETELLSRLQGQEYSWASDRVDLGGGKVWGIQAALVCMLILSFSVEVWFHLPLHGGTLWRRRSSTAHTRPAQCWLRPFGQAFSSAPYGNWGALRNKLESRATSR